MKRTIFIILIALVALTVVLLIKRPDILGDVWMYIVGLSAPIIVFFKKAIDFITGKSEPKSPTSTTNSNVDNTITTTGTNMAIANDQHQKEIAIKNDEIDMLNDQIHQLEGALATEKLKNISAGEQDDFEGITITVLRYKDDGASTLGLLFLNDKFYCYTLEDTFRDIKIKGQTRIAAGEYKLGFNRNLTGMTQRYRKTRPWFDFHLHIKNVPKFEGIYIHNGANHVHTQGCLLIADGLSSTNSQKILTNSRVTYERFYKEVGGAMKNGINVRVKLFDESWFQSTLTQSNL